MSFETYHKTKPGEVATAAQCKYCGSKDVHKAGSRKLKNGDTKQLYKCNTCGRRYSNLNKTGRRTKPQAILQAVMLRCQGYTYDEIIFVLNRKHKVKTTKGTLSKWMKEYNPPYFQLMDMNKRYKRVVLSWLFTHNDLNYDYKIHLPKLTFCNKRFPDLKSYLLNLPDFIDHSRFAEGNRCSQMKLYSNPGVQKQTYNELSAMVLNALTFATTNRQRHQVVEDYLLCCDRNTIAVEVPVYYHDKKFGNIHGHIDLLQLRHGKLYILDFKPNAHKESPQKVITQLTLYANALTFRAKVPRSEIRCAWFDEQHWYEFSPS